jgi:glutamate-1-semialdehyde 2,1-aminomutase
MHAMIQPAEGLRLMRSAHLLSQARESIAGGDSSTMRVLPYHLPTVMVRGDGALFWDADGNEYIDMNMAYGPLIFGHRPPLVMKALAEVLEQGTDFGFPNVWGIEVAERIKAAFPSIELLRFANSGTEAIASAVRLARAYTKRRLILLFEGHYHGWSEAVFHKYHAPVEELGTGDAIPGCEGMSGALADAKVLPWNEVEPLRALLAQRGQEVAAILMEPVMGNTGVIPPEDGYLQEVRALAQQYGCLLIFDEVITGYRIARGGAQERYGVPADITVLSKAIGGGVPIAAFGARRQIMDEIISGRVFHGGVYSGNPLVVGAARATLEYLDARADTIYPSLNQLGDYLHERLVETLSETGLHGVVQNVGPMLSLMLTDRPVTHVANYREARRHTDAARYIRFQHELQARGVYVHPNCLEPWYLSTSHTIAHLDTVVERVSAALQAVRRQG